MPLVPCRNVLNQVTFAVQPAYPPRCRDRAVTPVLMPDWPGRGELHLGRSIMQTPDLPAGPPAFCGAPLQIGGTTKMQLRRGPVFPANGRIRDECPNPHRPRRWRPSRMGPHQGGKSGRSSRVLCSRCRQIDADKSVQANRCGQRGQANMNASSSRSCRSVRRSVRTSVSEKANSTSRPFWTASAVRSANVSTPS